ncbi:MAG TPA: PqqD family protein [Longimicrobiales bacterium]
MLKLLRRRQAPGGPRVPSYKAAGHVVAARQGERTILLDARRGRYFGVDDVGATIWRLLAGGATLAELVAGLEEQYAAPRETLERDAATVVGRLERAHLVVVQ